MFKNPATPVCQKFGFLTSPVALRLSWLPLLTILLGAMAVGCQRGFVYRPGQVPASYLATDVAGVKRVNLARFAHSAPTSQGIYPGDLLNIAITTGLETDQTPVWPPVRVSEQGTVDLPLIGSVKIAGMDMNEAEQVVRQQGVRRGIYRAPNVSITLEQRRTNRITVVGAVEQPGVKELPAAQCDLFAALVAGGGLADDASTLVEVQRPTVGSNVATLAGYEQGHASRTRSEGPASERLDLARPDLVQHDLHLEDGSVVMVMEQPARTVQVMGLVKNPSQIEMPSDHGMRLLDAIAQAGGLTLQVANKVHVIRKVPGKAEPIVIQTTIRAAKSRGDANLLLAAGDVVSVEETPATFTVELLRSFIRFGFTSSIPGF